MNAWDISVHISKGLPITMDQKEILTNTLQIRPERQIRFADSSNTEDLIVFEIQPTKNSDFKDKTETSTNEVLLISISSDNIPEKMCILLEERMDNITSSWF